MSVKVKKCCCCIPLRGGLLGWGYFVLIMVIFNIVSMALLLNNISNQFPHKYSYPNSDSSSSSQGILFLLTILLGLVLNLIFYVVLLVGLHKRIKNLIQTFNGFLKLTMILSGMGALVLPVLVWQQLAGLIIYYVILIIILVEEAIIALVILASYYLWVCARSFASTLENRKEDNRSGNAKQNCNSIVLRDLKIRSSNTSIV